MATLIKRPNGIYHQVITLRGKRIWRSTGSRSRVEAIKIIQSESERKLPSKSSIKLSQFITQFQSYAETNFAPTTVLLYKQAVNTFIRLIGDYGLKEYTIPDIEDFKARRLQEVSAVKVNIDFRTVKALFQTAVRWKIIKENPFIEVKQVRLLPTRPAYL